ncbi:gamma-glutamyltransferase [Algicella marina]|uniref:Glutathione hydrolase proenzyme n=1 Tax=Algicella marina TaxID=2683284 RepID=A0A6P1T2R9_9RHOB|nr:gamma-glutamyltransferase [Algicella marina]QHQ36045.1 gamma-glutamyltransferase [Algicella marina]
MRYLMIGLAALGAPALAQEAQQPEETVAVAVKESVVAEKFMVAAANPLAAEAGREILARGGSAADALVAVQLVLNLVEPQSSGIGGGAFALYWDAEAGLASWDGREKAPMAADESYWLGADGAPVGWWDAVVGGRSVGVPGTLRLLETLHAEHGRLEWGELFQPAIRLAETGFAISPRMAASIASAQEQQLDLFPVAREYFFEADGSPKAEGTILKNPEFAATLKLLAAEGSAPFYEGEIADDIVAAVKTNVNPGILTMEDLAAYEVVEREPVCMAYRTYEVCGMGPPSSGALTVGQILGQLNAFEIGNAPSAEAWHLYIEAAKNAYADRGLYMADSDFVDMPEGLLDDDYLASRAALIDPDAAMESASPGEPPWEETRLWAPDRQVERPGTSHISIVDGFGDMLSITTTIETGFGSRVMVRGFLLNNELTDFSRAPEEDGKPIANRVEGGKRPRSSMAPTIVLEDGAPVLLIGSPGGSRIINYVAGALVRILDWGMDPQEALNAGHVVNRNGATDLEEGTEAAELASALEALGHEVNIANLNSGLHAILLEGGKLIGAADPRREGVAVGE